MKNTRRLFDGILGIVLITTTFTANAQITKLFPVVDENQLKPSRAPKADALFNEAYSEKIVYPLPPGVKLPTISFTESTQSTLGDLTTNNVLPHTTTFKTPVRKDEPELPIEPKLSIKLSSSTEGAPISELVQTIKSRPPQSKNLSLPIESSTSTEGTVIQQTIQFKQEDIHDEPSLTTEEPSGTDETSDFNASTLSTKSPLSKEINSSTTENPHDHIKTTPSTAIVESSPKPKQCTTPIGKTGECKDIQHCSSLLHLLMREPLLVENKLYLQQSQCGFENYTVWACCPDNVAPPITSPKLSLLPKPRKCGSMTENRLYGGHYTEIDSYSWMALLEYAKGGNETGFHCGGALISDRYILTAAHCVTGLPETWSIKNVRLGEWDLDVDMDCSKYGDFDDCSDPHINVDIEEVIPHKDYFPTSKNHLHDIALIRLSIQVNSTDFIEPICLPHGENNLHAFDEQSLDMVGWGATPDAIWNRIKQKTSAQVIQLNMCRSKYAENNITLEQSQFCAEGRMKNDTCLIDSGGPLISFDTSNQGLGSFYIAGIQSFGPSPCWVDGLPPVYTRVAEYLDWILENIHV